MQTDPIVVLTREDEDNLNLHRQLEDSGIRSLNYPCIRTRYLPESEWVIDPDHRLSDFQVFLFTSKRGVTGFRSRRDLLSDPMVRIGVVGGRTGKMVRKCFDREPDFVATVPTGEGLAESIMSRVDPGTDLLHIRGDKTTGALRVALNGNGYRLTELVVYQNIAPELEPLELDTPAIVVFASPSAAGRFFEVNRPGPGTHRYVAIGPTTGLFLNNMGLEGVFRADEPRDESILEKILELIKEKQ